MLLAVAETVAVLATGLFVYLSFNALIHPATLLLHITHLLPWPAEGTVRVEALLLMCLFRRALAVPAGPAPLGTGPGPAGGRPGPRGARNPAVVAAAYTRGPWLLRFCRIPALERTLAPRRISVPATVTMSGSRTTSRRTRSSTAR